MFEKFHWARTGRISTREFLNDIVLRVVCLGVVLPLLFSGLAFSNNLTAYSKLARSVVNTLVFVWPALMPQYEMVRQTLGEGSAASFGILSGVLWLLPSSALAIAFVEYQKRRDEILPAGAREYLILLILILAMPFELFVSGVGLSNRIYRFQPDASGLFFFLHYGLFLPTGLALTYLVFLPIRAVLDRWSKSQQL